MTEALFETRTLDQLPRVTAISPDALVGVQEEGGPVGAIAIKDLLGRLIQTDTAKETRADLLAELDHDAFSVGLVFADPDPAKNGWYRKVGASGGGTWSQFEKLSAYAAAEIGAYIDQAAASASAAQAALGRDKFANTGAGIAGTAIGETFWVDNGDGTGISYRHDAGPVATEIGRFVKDQTAPAAADVLAGGVVSRDGTKNVRIVIGSNNPQSYNLFLQSAADGKQVDGIYGYHETFATPGSAGYIFHGVAYSYPGVADGVSGGVGGAHGGPGGGSGVVGNRGDGGPGHGGVFTRLGTGDGNGVTGRASSTGTCSGGYLHKQNPVAGVAGPGPAAWLLNDSTNGEAFRARSASGNVEQTTGIVDRLNGEYGTCHLVRITGGGPRTALLRGAATHILPGAASTGAPAVIAHDFQINANVTGSADVRGINIANSATAGAEAFGGAVVVDGANTTNYGLFVNAANGATNHNLYLAGAGLLSVGGDIRALNDGTQDIGGPFARFDTLFATNSAINTSDARHKAWRGELSKAHLRAGRRIGAIMGLYQWLDQVAEKGEDGARIHFGARAQDVIEIFYDEGLEERPLAGELPSFRHAFLCYDRWDDILEPIMVKREVMVEEDDWVDTGETHLIQPKPYYVPGEDGEPELFYPEPYTVPVMVHQKVERPVVRWEKDGERVTKPAGDLYGLRLDEFALFLIAVQDARIAALETAA